MRQDVQRHGYRGFAHFAEIARVFVGFGALISLRSAQPSSPERADRFFPAVGLPLHIVVACALVLIVLGVRDGRNPALYFTALTAGMVFAGHTVLALVLSQKPAPDHDRSGAKAPAAASESSASPRDRRRTDSPHEALPSPARSLRRPPSTSS